MNSGPPNVNQGHPNPMIPGPPNLVNPGVQNQLNQGHPNLMNHGPSNLMNPGFQQQMNPGPSNLMNPVPQNQVNQGPPHPSAELTDMLNSQYGFGLMIEVLHHNPVIAANILTQLQASGNRQVSEQASNVQVSKEFSQKKNFPKRDKPSSHILL